MTRFHVCRILQLGSRSYGASARKLSVCYGMAAITLKSCNAGNTCCFTLTAVRRTVSPALRQGKLDDGSLADDYRAGLGSVHKVGGPDGSDMTAPKKAESENADGVDFAVAQHRD
jgi:hypothetical protein